MEHGAAAESTHDASAAVPESFAKRYRAEIDLLHETIRQIAHERDELKRLVEFLRKELDRIADLQKTPREHVDPNQIQLAFAELAKQLLGRSRRPDDDAPAGPPDTSGQGGNGPARRRTPHGRAILPEHLPVRTIILAPEPLPEGSVLVDQEVSFRLGYQPASFYRLKIVRPVFAVPREMAAAAQDTSATFTMGDVSWSPKSDETGRAGDAVDLAQADGAIGVDDPGAPASASVGQADESEPPSHEGLEATAPCAPGDQSGASISSSVESVPRENGSVARTTILCAPVPDEMIPRGLPTCETLAHVFTAKFADKIPFHRQEGISARAGIHLTRQTMCGWAEQCHELACVVVDAMCQEALKGASVIATDATGVLVQANERCKRGHFWVLVADQDHVVFRYSAKHSSEEPKQFLAGFAGIVLADASSVYDALYAQKDGPQEAACWSHGRRYFYKAIKSDRTLALQGLGFCNKLFEIERDLVKLPPEKRLILRQQRAGPVIELLQRWRDDLLLSAEVDDRSPLRRALGYLKNQWTALTLFLRDGRVPIHNNRSELELRRLVIGRANWLFVGSDESAPWTCTFVSLVASCQLHGLDPEAYLRDLFRILPAWPRARAIELAPKYWSETRARLDTRELELPLGPLTIPPRLAPSQ